MFNKCNHVYLYHGSDVIVKEPLLNKCNEGKDFGQGFYLSFKPKQATNFSKIIKRRNSSEHTYVSEYLLEDLDKLKIYEFVEADAEWLECILNYRQKRNHKSKWDKYDVLIGKIADDDTAKTINAYINGAYGDPNTKQAINFAISMFKTNRLEYQICFRTPKAIKHLKYNGYYKDEP